MVCCVCKCIKDITEIFEVDWENIEENSLPASIEVMTGITISPSNCFSLSICQTCVTAVRKHMEFRLKCFRDLEESEVPIAKGAIADGLTIMACRVCYRTSHLRNMFDTELTRLGKGLETTMFNVVGTKINFDLTQKICQMCLSILRVYLKTNPVDSSNVKQLEVSLEEDAEYSAAKKNNHGTFVASSSSRVINNITVSCYMCYSGSNLLNIFDPELIIFDRSLQVTIAIITGHKLSFDEEYPKMICQTCLNAIRIYMKNKKITVNEQSQASIVLLDDQQSTSEETPDMLCTICSHSLNMMNIFNLQLTSIEEPFRNTFDVLRGDEVIKRNELFEKICYSCRCAIKVYSTYNPGCCVELLKVETTLPSCKRRSD